MSELPFDEPEAEEEEERQYEIDPSHVAFLDQQSAAFEGEREGFKEAYGFDHECTCGTDYTDGKVGMVTECFVKLCSQALDRSAQATALLAVVGPALESMIAVNQDLMGMLEKHGHAEELSAYMEGVEDDDGESPADLEE